MLKRAYYIGYIGYLFLLVLALFFYKERTIFTDNAFHLFDILDDSSFTFQNYRYGAAFTQIVPLAGSWFSLSLNGILIAYSVCFVVYYALCYFICGSVFKNYKLALALLLFNILFVSDTFFWMLSELPQGIAFMMVIFSYLGTKEKTTTGLYIFTFFAVIAIIIFFHPLMMFPFLFLVAFFYLDGAKYFSKRLLLAGVVFFVFAFVLKKLVFTTPYEENASGIGGKLLGGLTHYFDLFSTKKFLQNCLTKYCWITVLFILTAAFYIARRKWTKLALFCAAILGYMSLINLSYPNSDVAQFYIENMYLPLGVFLAIPLVYDLLPALKGRNNIAYGFLLLLIVTASVRIVYMGTFYTSRLDWERKYLAANGDNKLLVAQETVPMDTLLMSWGTPYEFWLLSTVEQGWTASITINENVDNLAWGVNDPRAFLPTWGFYKYENLPQRYFKFKDTTSTYKIVR